MKKVVIIANGAEPLSPAFKHCLNNAAFVIAADGGIKFCKKYKIVPDYHIGDMDSSQQDLTAGSKTKVIHLRDQNTTDLQKALQFAESLSPDIVDVFAAFGKRADHGLGNILVLNTHSASFKLLMHDDYGFFSLLTAGEEPFFNKNGCTVSLFSLQEISDLQLTGFEFNVNPVMLQTPFLGVSNRIISDKATISFSNGRLIVYELTRPANKVI